MFVLFEIEIFKIEESVKHCLRRGIDAENEKVRWQVERRVLTL